MTSIKPAFANFVVYSQACVHRSGHIPFIMTPQCATCVVFQWPSSMSYFNLLYVLPVRLRIYLTKMPAIRVRVLLLRAESLSLGSPGVGVPESLGGQASIARVPHPGFHLSLVGDIAKSLGLPRGEMQL